MGVDAAEAERADPGEPDGVGPGPGGARDLHAEAGGVGAAGRAAEVDGRVQLAVPHAEEGPDQSGDARRVVQVPDVGLDRTDRQGRGPGAEHRGQAFEFDRVAERGAGAVALQVSGVGGVGSGTCPGRADGPALRGGAGRADGGDGPAVVQHRAAAQDRVDRGAVGAGLGDGGEQQHGAALTGYGAVGVRVVGAAPPAAGDQFGHGRGLLGRQAVRAQAHSAGQGVPGIAGGEFAAGVVDRGQRAVAAGVHGVAGAGQAEDVGDAGRGAERHVAERAERPGVARGGPVGGG